MNTSSDGLRHCGQVNDKVADLTEEVVLVRIPVRAVAVVRIRVNDSKACETGSGLNSRWVECITDELGVVQLLDGRADHVRSGGEVDDGGSDGRAVASVAAAAACSDR